MCLDDNNKEFMDNKEFVDNKEFMDFWEEMEQQFKEDSLTEEQRTQMIEDFKKNDIHLIIGGTEQAESIEYKQCIDWPAASKEDMRKALIETVKTLTGSDEIPADDPWLSAMLRELE